MKAIRLSRCVGEGLQHTYLHPSRGSKAPTRHIFRPSSRQLSTSVRLRASIAAPEINFDSAGGEAEGEGERKEAAGGEGGEGEAWEKKPTKFFARLVPVSPSYFTTQPGFTDDFLLLRTLSETYSRLPRVSQEEAPRISWRTLVEYRNDLGETIKAAKYSKLTNMLRDLNRIDPAAMPSRVKEALDMFTREINPLKIVAKAAPLDRLGRSLGAGRRKSSSATAWLVEGTGEVLVNGKTLVEAFARVHDRESAIWALKATDRIGKYNVWARVTGGGSTGQAEALTLAVGKALLGHEPALKPALRIAGCVTRDPRRVERKKHGHVKARKKPAWVKR